MASRKVRTNHQSINLFRFAVNSRSINTTHMRMDIYQHDRFGIYHQNNNLLIAIWHLSFR